MGLLEDLGSAWNDVGRGVDAAVSGRNDQYNSGADSAISDFAQRNGRNPTAAERNSLLNGALVTAKGPKRTTQAVSAVTKMFRRKSDCVAPRPLASAQRTR